MILFFTGLGAISCLIDSEWSSDERFPGQELHLAEKIAISIYTLNISNDELLIHNTKQF